MVSAHRKQDLDLAQHLVQMVTLSTPRGIEESLNNKLELEGLESVAPDDLVRTVRAIRFVLEKNDPCMSPE